TATQVRCTHLGCRRLDVDCFTRFTSSLRLLRAIDELRRRITLEIRQSDVLAHVEVDDETRQTTILGHEINAVCDRVLRILDSQRLAVEHNFGFKGFLNAKDRSGYFRTTRPDESRKTEHFAFSDIECHPVIRVTQRAQATHLKTAVAFHSS